MTAAPLQLALHPLAEVGADVRSCELDVLNHWYGDTADLLDRAYGPYLEQTVFLTLTDAGRGVVGFCRLILPGDRQLKTIADIERPPWEVDGRRAATAAGVDLTRTWDIATLGVRHQVVGAGSVAAAALYHGLILATRVNEIPWVIAIIDRRVRSLLAILGLPLQALPGTRPESYMGSSACAPVYTHLPSVLDAQRRSSPDAFRLVALGTGLDGVSVPALEEFRVSVTRAGDRQAVQAEPLPLDLRDPARSHPLL